MHVSISLNYCRTLEMLLYDMLGHSYISKLMPSSVYRARLRRVSKRIKAQHLAVLVSVHISMPTFIKSTRTSPRKKKKKKGAIRNASKWKLIHHLVVKIFHSLPK